MFRKTRHLPAQPMHAKTGLSSVKAADGMGTERTGQYVRTTKGRPACAKPLRRRQGTPLADPAPSRGHAFSTCPGGETQFISVKTELPYLKVSRTGTRFLGSQEKTKM
ncbi:MAG: hypothetical protein V3T42_13330 [Nitrospirales bacterium]